MSENLEQPGASTEQKIPPRLILILGGARSGKSAFAERLAASGGRPVAFIATATASDDEMRERIARHRASRPKGWHTLEEPLDLARAVRQAAELADVVLLDCVTLWLGNVLLQASGQHAQDELGTNPSGQGPFIAPQARPSSSPYYLPPRQGGGARQGSPPCSINRHSTGDEGGMLGGGEEALHTTSRLFDERALKECEALLTVVKSLGPNKTLIVVTNEVGLGIVPAYPLGRIYRDTLGYINQRLAEAADRVYLMVAGMAVDIKRLHEEASL